MEKTNNMTMNGKICRYFASDSYCFYGDECQFVHTNQQNNQHNSQHNSNRQLPPLTAVQTSQESNSLLTNAMPQESRQAYIPPNNGLYVDPSLTTQMSGLTIDSQNNRRKNNTISSSNSSVNLNTHSLNSSNSCSIGSQHMTSSLVANYFITDSIKDELIRKLSLTQQMASNEMFLDLPQIDIYHELIPLESSLSSPSSTFNGFVTTVFRATNSKTGQYCSLRRVHAFQPNTQNAKQLINSIDNWKKLRHSNVVQLRNVFTSKAFGDNSVIFVFDYHPGSQTLMSQMYSNSSNSSSGTSSMNGYSTSSRPYSQQNSQRKLLPEPLIWNYIIQISSALRAIHSANMSCRTIDPTKIIITSGSTSIGVQSNDYPRLRLSGCGVFDVLTHESFLATNTSKATALLQHFQQEDLLAFGKLCLALASNNISIATQRDDWQSSLDLISRSYSADLRSLIYYLLSYKSNSGTTHTINDIMPRIGARFYTQLDSLYQRDDALVEDLSKEIDNGRILRLLVKLGTINERPEHQLDPNWSETGDRYMLKLFRDYLFHQYGEDGRPWMDLGHVISNLNKLDMGSPEKICLISRDELNILIVSFAELKRCFESSMNELML